MMAPAYKDVVRVLERRVRLAKVDTDAERASIAAWVKTQHRAAA
ncbi:MAG: hypothetical protein ACRETX_09925 [Steroidobacteraceae bacterium]